MEKLPLRLDGAPNFRDAGGYRVEDGARVRPLRLFRSGALAQLNTADLAQLASLDIGLLYDLRGQVERGAAPNRWPAGRPLEVYSGFEESRPAPRIFGWRERLADPAFDAEAADNWMLHAYAAMPAQFAGVLASLFQRLSAPAAPAVLLHCTAGKDRTGFVCALLLLALGVPRDAVYADYLLTARRQPPDVLLHQLLGDELALLPQQVVAATRVMASVREAYLDTALEAIARDYGRIDIYLAQACGLDASRRAALQAALLV